MSELTYKRSGDYLIPNLSLNSQELPPLGKYGRMRKTYLKEHRPILWNNLLLTGKLDSHLREIDRTANSRLEQMMTELAMLTGVTESLKEKSPMAWTQQMNALKAQAEEVVVREVVYAE